MFTLYRMATQYRLNSNGTELDWNKSFTHIEPRAGAVGREGCGELLNPGLHS